MKFHLKQFLFEQRTHDSFRAEAFNFSIEVLFYFDFQGISSNDFFFLFGFVASRALET
jgi:hypothetical protein